MEDVTELVADTLSLKANDVEPLTNVLFEQTLDDPFYI
jgi:hypothetical protein